ncbi:MAG: hypothetical protein AAF799_01285 [Myxococcota bacterium]
MSAEDAPYSFVRGVLWALAAGAAAVYMSSLPALLIAYAPALAIGLLGVAAVTGAVLGSKLGRRGDAPCWAQRLAASAIALTLVVVAAIWLTHA